MLHDLACRWLVATAILAGLAVAPVAACPEPGRGIGVSRVVEVDATDGPVFGFITKQKHEARFLGPKEAVLTFDDGPLPNVTRAILDILDQFCTKATFFSVGRMAVAYPDSVRDIMKRGHTLGTHTWSHPMSLPRLSQKQARDQIEAGFAAVSMAAGQPIAPFFRFPGLNDSSALLQHLGGRNIATFTVDVVSNDSYIADTQHLIERTLSQLEQQQGGIMLFHDIKYQTARALPTILAEMKRRGYKVVHLTSKHPYAPDPAYIAAVDRYVADRKIGPQRPALASIVETPAAPSPRAEVASERQGGPALPTAVSPTPAQQAVPPVVARATEDEKALPLDAYAAGSARVAEAPVLPSTPVVPRASRPVAAETPAVPPASVAHTPSPPVAPAPKALEPHPNQQIEIIAGLYPEKPNVKPKAPLSASAPMTTQAAPPRSGPGSQPAAVPRPTPPAKSWQEQQRRRQEDNGS